MYPPEQGILSGKQYYATYMYIYQLLGQRLYVNTRFFKSISWQETTFILKTTLCENDLVSQMDMQC